MLHWERRKAYQYKRTTCMNYSESVHKLLVQLSETSDNYLKHKTYVDNCNSLSPLIIVYHVLCNIIEKSDIKYEDL